MYADSRLRQAQLGAAREDFRQARRKASLEQLVARFTGRSVDLLSFEEVRRKLRATDMAARGLRDVPLGAIVGTTGRYADFTRTFLPRSEVDEQRWAKVKAVAEADLPGLPPVELYKLGEAYFVKDGHHRVSVARQLGTETIQAYVTEVSSKVPLSPDDQPEDLIRKAEQAEFLARAGLDQLRPDADFTVSAPGQYTKLHDLIELHGYVLETQQNRNLTDAEVVTSWYDNDYLPIVRLIRERGLLRDFPGRTETDLYVWLAEHSAEVRAELGWQVPPTAMLADMAAKFRPRPGQLGQWLNLAIPAGLATGPETGVWRKEKLEVRYSGGLFTRILVPVSGEPDGWAGLAQALVLSRRELGELMGLHVVRDETAKGSETAEAVRDEFNRRCAVQQQNGTLAVEVGEVAAKICERAALADLVVLNLAHPPGAGPLQRLSSGLRALIRRCPCPVLAVPGPVSFMQALLLAYDGSPKSKEALFVAAYMAEAWNSSLTVLAAADGKLEADGLDFARKYLEFHEVDANYVEAQGEVATAILQTVEAQAVDLILMGSYGAPPVVEVVVGSSVDRVLRESQRAVLICQ